MIVVAPILLVLALLALKALLAEDKHWDRFN